MIRLVAAMLCLLAAIPARADDLRPGYLEWSEAAPGRWQVVWKAPLLGGLATRARPLVPEGCAVVISQRRFAGPAVVERLEVTCEAPLAGRQLGLTGLEQGFTDALLRVRSRDGGVQSARLTPDAPTVAVAATPSRGEVAWTYLKLGFEHILVGFDHLLFVVALVLLIGGARRIVTTVTAFTLAHSLTLAATTLGVMTVARKPVEICIALSIVLIALELLRPADAPRTLARRAPELIAFAFGLLHGFGFAAALAEIGLPAGEIPLALLTFNIGVELGQLAIVAAALLALAVLARTPQFEPPMLKTTAYAIGIVASAWLIERVFA